jgi:hypothetical protein
MAKDAGTITLGVLYTCLVFIIWTIILRYISYYTSFYPAAGGIFIGSLFLIPSVILYMVFYCSTEGHTSASVGFGLGLPGWIIAVIGIYIGFVTGYINFLDGLIFFFYVLLIIFGSILFSYRHSWEEPYYTRSVRPAPPALSQTPLQPPSQPISQMIPGPPCSKCSRATRYIAQYDRYYCDHCQKYS